MTYPAQPPEPPPLVHLSSTAKVSSTLSESSWVPQKPTVAVGAKFDRSTPPTDIRDSGPPHESGDLALPPVVWEPSLPDPLPPSYPNGIVKVPVATEIKEIEPWEAPIETIGYIEEIPTFSHHSRELDPFPPATDVTDVTFSVDRPMPSSEVVQTPEISDRPPTPIETVGEIPRFSTESTELDEVVSPATLSSATQRDFTFTVDRPVPSSEVVQTPLEPIQQRGDLPSFSTNSTLLNPPSPSRGTGDFAFSLDRSISPQLSQTQSTGAFQPLLAEPAPDPFKRPIQPSPPGGGLQDLFGLPEPIEVTADVQEFDERRDIFTATGNVVMRYQGAIVDADWLEVNLRSRLAIGEGNIALTQPERVLRGDRFRYNLLQETGTIFQARGELSSVTPEADNSTPVAPSGAIDPNGTRLLSDRIFANQPLEVIPTGGGLQGNIGAGRGSGESGFSGTINRFRFEAERVDFYPGGWQGSEVRLTNDPFGPEFELRANTATFTRLSALQDEILLDNPRLVFDDAFALPLFRERFVIDRRPRDPTPIQIGFDGRDRGGLFLFRDFEVLQTRNTSLTLTPQYYIQRGFDRRNLLSLDELGIVAQLNSTLSPDTTFTGIASFTNLNPDTFDPDGDPFDDDDGDLRASARLEQEIGTHTLTTEYSYRDRLFNGSLGFRTIHQTAGIVLTSPNFPIGTTGINVRYQGGLNWIEANTDRADLLDLIRDDNRASMVRFQGIVDASKALFLWLGEGLPPTPEEGLRYTPVPVVPYIQLFFNARGIAGLYTRSDPNHNLSLRGTVGLQGQFGHFSDSFLDYTGFNISLSETISDGESPFFFDREVDRRRLSLGITQQIFGPLRASIQTSINLRTGEAFSTDYVLEYSRRSYGVVLRFNPDRELGSLSLRISDFNWTGNTAPFFETEDF